MKSYLKILIIFGVAINFFSSVWSAFNYRFLMQDGFRFLLTAIDRNSIYWDPNYMRYAHAIFQLPSLIVVRFTQLVNLFDQFLITFGITILLVQASSVCICFFLLRKYRKTQWIAFVLLSFACASQISAANTFGLVTDNLTIMWPMLLVVVFSGGLGLAEFLGLTLGAIFLSFCHETSILCLGVLIIAQCNRLRLNLDSGAKFKWVSTWILAIFVLAAVWTLFRIFLPSRGTSIFFTQHVTTYWGPFTWSQILLVFAFFLEINGTKKTEFLWTKVILILAPVALTIYGFMTTNGADLHWYAVFSRTAVVPIGCFIGLLVVFKSGSSFFPKFENNFLWLIVTTSLILSGSVDIARNYHWQKAWSHMGDIVANLNGCTEFDSKNKKIKLVQGEGMNLNGLPYFSILVQKKMAPEFLALWKNERVTTNLNSCCLLKYGEIELYEETKELSSFKLFSFKKVIDNFDSQKFCP